MAAAEDSNKKASKPSLRKALDQVLKSQLNVYPDSELTDILLRDLDTHGSDNMVMGRLAERLACYISKTMEVINSWVPLYGHFRQPEWVCLLDNRPELWKFFYFFYEKLIIEATESGAGKCLLRPVLDWVLTQPADDILVLIENVSARIARLVDALALQLASVARCAWKFYEGSGVLIASTVPLIAPSGLAIDLIGHFRFFRVNIETGDLIGCLSDQDPEYFNSEFRVQLVDNYGGLLSLLYELTKLKILSDSTSVSLGVDLEGVCLSREGALALVQLSLSTDPSTVFIVDVIKLGHNAFDVSTHAGISVRRILEDPLIRKVFFDPRHDVDALYHQFEIAPQNVFDLQIAEVAIRRARGLSVRYVQSLFKCLNTQEGLLTEKQKQLAERINRAGKELFEPDQGGNYNVFLQRPLHPCLLVYASHDARYLIPLQKLFDEYLSRYPHDWMKRVCETSQTRAQWYLHTDYVSPTTEAPWL